MSKLRVFQNVKRKRTASGFSVKNLGTVLLLIMLLPYIITFLFGNLWKEEAVASLLIEEQLNDGRFSVINQTAYGNEHIPLEIYVADKLSRTMGDGFEKEALKAQAILIRTNLLAGMEKEIRTEDDEFGKKAVTDVCRIAAAETRGMYITYEGKPAHAAYCRVSNGATRKAEEVLKEDYPYLTSVPCNRDFLSEEYVSVQSFGLTEFKRLWEEAEAIREEEIGEKEVNTLEKFELVRDSAGYVTYIKYHDKWVAGEQFRYLFNLPSASFQIEEGEKEITFTVKGAGHGLGMSQFGANEMAKEGSTYIEIIEYFFQGTSITKS